MESFRYHDLGRIAYADALEYQTAAFEVLLDAKATGKKEDNQLFFCEHLPVLTIGKSGKDSNLLIPEETLRERGVSFYHINRGGDITYHKMDNPRKRPDMIHQARVKMASSTRPTEKKNPL